jgi:hypothetical protein
MLRSVQPPCDLSDALLALIAPGDTKDVSDRIVDYALRACVGFDLAGLFVVTNEKIVTAACTDRSVADLDQLQFELDEGPCLDAVSERCTYHACDLAVDTQWPRFGSAAQRIGIRSVLAIPLAAEGVRALALYAYSANAFRGRRLDRATTFATVAAIALDLAGASCDHLSPEVAREGRHQP